ncbi:hypothetical protein G3578_11370 [Brevibacillus sp. SYP-B805]|uniref:hypothetical protein n=1 Tax=Brevibacillus sp. SYP-B805 TaxID=1578199 RepID=UPI0013EAC766|nr:hypothetical protein [Brevibacillus sp. SYP-B805]NGQ95754.1 hypothetical protein [Brevibacillus sp. SYP-B805]
MKWAAIMGVTALFVFMTMYEWPKMKGQMRREKTAFAALTILAWALSILLICYPDMPGPTQWINAIFKPLVTFLEK